MSSSTFVFICTYKEISLFNKSKKVLAITLGLYTIINTPHQKTLNSSELGESVNPIESWLRESVNLVKLSLEESVNSMMIRLNSEQF